MSLGNSVEQSPRSLLDVLLRCVSFPSTKSLQGFHWLPSRWAVLHQVQCTGRWGWAQSTEDSSMVCVCLPSLLPAPWTCLAVPCGRELWSKPRGLGTASLKLALNPWRREVCFKVHSCASVAQDWNWVPRTCASLCIVCMAHQRPLLQSFFWAGG